jgi:hypothetical protein
MKKDYQKAARALDALLTDDAEMSVEELTQDLESQGVNVNAYLAKFKVAVRKGYQQRIRSAAEKANKTAEAVKGSLFGDLLQKNKDELLAIREQIIRGDFGATLQKTCVARCRNAQGTEVSEEELRSWLEDIATSSSKQ